MRTCSRKRWERPDPNRPRPASPREKSDRRVPRCLHCVHVRQEDTGNPYASAVCALQPAVGFFGLNWVACVRWEPNALAPKEVRSGSR